MKKQIKYAILLHFFIVSITSYSQNVIKTGQPEQVSKLFRSQEFLPIKLNYSTKELKNKTNDSTYIISNISYRTEDGSWKMFELELRVRGYFRLRTCYFPPLKMKIKKAASKGTLFEGNKKLKLVLPCWISKGKNDYVVKEYMAYKLYEIISPYYYKTRMADVSLTETKGKKTKIHDLRGIFIEDDKNLAKRYGGKTLKKFIHPLNQDHVTSVQNAFFQFMIGNTDFSTAVRHNAKLFFINSKIVPVPYDFDMSGLVNARYAVVPVVNGEPLAISSVRERLYRGFKRDPKIIQQVREEFINKKSKLLGIVNGLEPQFDSPKEFSEAKKYILSFFKIIENDNRFEQEITNQLRSK